MVKTQKTLILVADGARARFYENTGVGKGVAAAGVSAMEGERTPARDIDADRPGRAQAPAGSGRQGLQSGVDAHERAEAEFLRDVAAVVEDAIAKGEYGRLIVLAPPRALGIVRGHYGARAKAALHGEVDKDLVDADEAAIARNVNDMLAT